MRMLQSVVSPVTLEPKTVRLLTISTSTHLCALS